VPAAVSFEWLLRQWRSETGLYLLGAGASSGIAPLGRAFWTTAPLDFLRSLTSFSAEIPNHSLLTLRMIENSSGITISDIYPGREIRAGSWEYPIREILQRIPNFYDRIWLKHLLSKPNFAALQNDNYGVFNFFRPSLIANYNHEGLATRLCGQRRHRILEMHGSVGREFGSPDLESFINQVREYHLPEVLDGIVMGVPESCADQALALNLLTIGRFNPRFIAIIGYSFAKTANGYDDDVSVAYFEQRYREFQGNIYVIDPQPEHLREMLSERLMSKNIVEVRARWNVLAHAFAITVRRPSARRSINYAYQHLLDAYGSNTAFPLPRVDR
jgi:hypothetical protein